MRLPEYDRLDALALGDLVARREVTPAELLEAALERADARNPRLNAIVARYDDEARARARGPLPAGPLSGVPFLLKDLFAAWKDHPLSWGSRLGAGMRPDRDSEVVRRLQAGGLVLFGRGTRPTRRAARRAGRRRRSRPASSRRRTAPTAAAPSGSRPPTAPCSA